MCLCKCPDGRRPAACSFPRLKCICLRNGWSAKTLRRISASINLIVLLELYYAINMFETCFVRKGCKDLSRVNRTLVAHETAVKLARLQQAEVHVSPTTSSSLRHGSYQTGSSRTAPSPKLPRKFNSRTRSRPVQQSTKEAVLSLSALTPMSACCFWVPTSTVGYGGGSNEMLLGVGDQNRDKITRGTTMRRQAATPPPHRLAASAGSYVHARLRYGPRLMCSDPVIMRRAQW